MRKNLKNHWLLILAILLGFLLRFWRVGSLPVILNRDEAALAYNAYLLSETGKDEWGRSWPISLESFGDYKLPGYVWVLVSLFEVFTPTDTIVRLPSVISGTLLILVTFLWIRSLKIPKKFAILGAWLVALLPVSIFYSRMAYEANVGLTLMVAALWLITDLKSKWNFKRISLLFLILLFGIFTYNTPWLLLPFFAGYTFLLFPYKKRKKSLLLIGMMGVIFLVGVKVFLSLTAQKSGITIFSDETIWSEWINYRENLDPRWLWLLGSKYAYWLGLIWQRFWQSFTPDFLVTHGDNHSWHSLPTWGHLSWLVYGAGWIGLVNSLKRIIVSLKLLKKSAKKKLEFKQEIALVFLLFTSISASVITVDSPHATRSLLFFIIWVVFAVKGLEWLYKLKIWQTKKVFWFVVISIMFLETIWHSHQLFNTYPKNQEMFQPGYDSMIQFIDKKSSGKPVAIVDPSGYSYILTAWYLKMSPETYFSTNVRQLPDKIGFRYGEQVANFHFIASPDDASETEEILLQWRPKNNGWQIYGLN